MLEEWRPIAQRPERYEVSNLGRVRSIAAGREPRVLKPYVRKGGYHRYAFKIGGKNHYFDAHRLVAAAYLGEPTGPLVRHLDGVPGNNAATNLAYGTLSDNSRDALRHGTHPQASKTHCRSGHPFNADNTYDRRGHRQCRACNRAAVARYKERSAVA